MILGTLPSIMATAELVVPGRDGVSFTEASGQVMHQGLLTQVDADDGTRHLAIRRC